MAQRSSAQMDLLVYAYWLMGDGKVNPADNF